MKTRLLIAAMFCIASAGAAHAQDMPDPDVGNLPDAMNLPGLPTTPGVTPQRIGGETGGTVFFNPVVDPAGTGPVSDAGLASRVMVSVDLTMESALRSQTQGRPASSAPSTSAWKVSGFGLQTPPGRSAINPQSMTTLRQSFSYNSSLVNQPGQTGPTQATSFEPVPLFTRIPAQPAGSLSDLPGVAPATGESIEGLSANADSLLLAGIATNPVESSIQAPGAGYLQYRLAPRSHANATRSRGLHRRTFATLHERESVRASASRRRPQRTRPTGLTERERQSRYP